MQVSIGVGRVDKVSSNVLEGERGSWQGQERAGQQRAGHAGHAGR